MPIQFTTRWGLPYPKSTAPRSDSADVPRDVRALALALDDHAKDDQGVLTDRPVSTVGTPGKKGRYYTVVGDASPAENGRTYRDYGTGWLEIGPLMSLTGTLALRPTASTVRAGTKYFATDQVAEYRSDGVSTWTRISTPAGVCSFIFADTADPGYVLVAGQAWPATTGIYADLYARWQAKYPSVFPDPLGRAIVVKGTHGSVDTIGSNDGYAASARRPHHRHSVTGPTSKYDIYQTNVGGRTAYSPDSSAPNGPIQVGNPDTVTVGPQTGSEPIDTIAYLVANLQAKL